MKTPGWIAKMDKGAKYASDDVLIKECGLKNGKHRHRRVKKHKQIYNGIARAMAKENIRKEWDEYTQ